MKSYYTQENHGPFEQSSIGNLSLEMGGILRDCSLAYSAHGRLNTSKSNAILIPTWYSGTSKILADHYVGSGRALDPEKYFILIVNQIGGGLSTSPNNYARNSMAPEFPVVTIGDDVRAQHTLATQTFGIERFALVAGASMGAQQAYEWAVRYPDMVSRLAAVAGTAKTTPYVAFVADAMNAAIKADPGWNNGRYASPADVAEGLRQQARLWSLLGFSSEFFDRRAWIDVGYASAHEAVLGLLETETLLMDPNCLLSQATKWKQADVGRYGGWSLNEALKRIQARTLVMPIDTDMIFTSKDCRAEEALIGNSEFREIRSGWGHLALFAMEQAFRDQIDQHLISLLDCPA